MAGKSLWIGTSWKMNKTRAEARAFATAVAADPLAHDHQPQLFIIPPFTAIADVADLMSATKVRIGGQNMHWADAGAWTGEISPPMLKDVGASLVELGHSERRMHFNETNETVARKVAAALAHALTPLVCIGDTAAEHRAGQTASVLAEQMRMALSLVEPAQASRVILAYEPVWSIGEGGVPADPAFANAQHQLLKDEITARFGYTLPVLYGGSVNAGNCVALASQPAIDGLFIGRAAWDVRGFLNIARLASA